MFKMQIGVIVTTHPLHSCNLIQHEHDSKHSSFSSSWHSVWCALHIDRLFDWSRGQNQGRPVRFNWKDEIWSNLHRFMSMKGLTVSQSSTWDLTTWTATCPVAGCWGGLPPPVVSLCWVHVGCHQPGEGGIFVISTPGICEFTTWLCLAAPQNPQKQYSWWTTVWFLFLNSKPFGKSVWAKLTVLVSFHYRTLLLQCSFHRDYSHSFKYMLKSWKFVRNIFSHPPPSLVWASSWGKGYRISVQFLRPFPKPPPYVAPKIGRGWCSSAASRLARWMAVWNYVGGRPFVS